MTNVTINGTFIPILRILVNTLVYSAIKSLFCVYYSEW